MRHPRQQQIRHAQVECHAPEEKLKEEKSRVVSVYSKLYFIKPNKKLKKEKDFSFQTCTFYLNLCYKNVIIRSCEPEPVAGSRSLHNTDSIITFHGVTTRIYPELIIY